MLPFDTQVWHERQICLRFHRILKVILEMAFSAHNTQSRKLNLISMTIIRKVAWKCIWCCHRVQRCVTALYGRGKLCSGAWKHGQDGHIGMFSLCRKSHNKDKTVMRASYLYNGNQHTWKNDCYIEIGPSLPMSHTVHFTHWCICQFKYIP